MCPVAFNPYIVNNGVTYNLPLPIEMWDGNPQFENGLAPLYGQDGQLFLYQNQRNTTVEISGKIVGSATLNDYSSGLDNSSVHGHISTLYQAFIGVFNLYRYDNFVYQNCICQSFKYSFEKPDIVANWSASIVCFDPTGVQPQGTT